MNCQRGRTLQEAVTTADAAEVIEAAKEFFGTRNGVYAAFLEKEGPGYATFRGQGGEEIAIGTVQAERGTRVTGSTYLFDQQVARFLALLPSETGIVGAGVEPVAGETA